MNDITKVIIYGIIALIIVAALVKAVIYLLPTMLFVAICAGLYYLYVKYVK